MRSKRSLLLSALLLLVPCFPLAGTKVAVEAAHGGSDHGGKAAGQVEKDWTLRFSLALTQALKDSGLVVVPVRVKDETVTQDKRFEILNTSGAAAALILHADRESTGKVRGPWFVVQPPQSGKVTLEEGLPEAGSLPLGRYKQSLRLARVLAEAVGVSPKFSPLSDARALVGDPSDPEGRVLAAPHESLRFVALPAVVIEPLLMTSKEDLDQYASDAAVQEFTRKIAKGFSQYLQGGGNPP